MVSTRKKSMLANDGSSSIDKEINQEILQSALYCIDHHVEYLKVPLTSYFTHYKNVTLSGNKILNIFFHH